jgi:hypothetical protein
MFELEFDNGNKIQVTGNHKFLTDQGWIRADELTHEHDIINKKLISTTADLISAQQER